MSRVILDPDLKARLNGLNEHLEICDADGRTVGHFLPADLYRKIIYKIAEADCPDTPEELERMRNEIGGRPLAEIWRDLGQP
jgi:hypothetical protein